MLKVLLRLLLFVLLLLLLLLIFYLTLVKICINDKTNKKSQG